MMYKRVFQKDIRLFWTIEGETYPISDLVTIHDISTDFWRDGKSYVEFTCSSAAKNFLVNFQRGTIEARYNVFPEDSPFAGEPFCIIRDMKPASTHIKPLTSWDAWKTKDEVEFTITANCKVSWTYLKEEIEKHFVWQEERRKNEDAKETDPSDV